MRCKHPLEAFNDIIYAFDWYRDISIDNALYWFVRKVHAD